MDLAFYGRVSTEDAQDPEASRAWQLRRARDLVSPLGHSVVAEFFDIGQSRSLPWKRRPEAARLLEVIRDPERSFDGIVIGEPQRAFYGNQFGLTFPVLVHYGVALWVPEVGGRVDPDSEAHDLVMSLFGGMSKGERSRIRTRTRMSMQELAASTDRFLGGRPPYGYTLADVGPHPNPSKAAAGQRAHRLVPDPITAPVVARIFQLYVGGMGFRGIAELLTREGIPSPSQYDRVRNQHRDPRGWSHSAVRAILANPTYSGSRVWGKQEKHESLMDVNDVAAGTQVRMRWRQQDEWVRPLQKTHEALVDDETIQLAQGRITGHVKGERRPRVSKHVYPLRGRIYCSACGRRMQGTTLTSRTGKARAQYRCETRNRHALPDSDGHPSSVTVSAARVQAAVDAWALEFLSDPEWIASSQQANEVPAEVGVLRAKLREVEAKSANLLAAIESGVAPAALVAALGEREREAAEIKARIAALSRPRTGLSPREVALLLESVGGVAKALTLATDEEKGELYAALGLRLTYDHAGQSLFVEADLAGCWDKSCPEGDLNPHALYGH